MYLAVCEDQKEYLDAVCSLLDVWAALLESARQERLTFYLSGQLSSAGLRPLRGESLPVSRALRKEAASRWLNYHLKRGY